MTPHCRASAVADSTKASGTPGITGLCANPELRFEPLNVWKQCAPCNNHKSGDIVNYRIKLVKRIGADKIAWLEGPHDPKRYTIEDLKVMKADYRAMIRELKGAA